MYDGTYTYEYGAENRFEHVCIDVNADCSFNNRKLFVYFTQKYRVQMVIA